MGTTFAFTLNEAATVKLTFAHQKFGRVARANGHGDCVALTKHNRQRRNCVRMVAAGGLSLKAASGANEIRFAGRISPNHKLSIGSYTVTITATIASGESSAPKSLRFTIVKQSTAWWPSRPSIDYAACPSRTCPT